MLKQILLLLVFYFMCGLSGQAQIERDCLTGSATVSSGSASGLTVLQCIGQGSVIGNFQSNRLTVRQGFLQPQLSAFANQDETSLSLEVYPNPFSHKVFLNFSESFDETVSIHIYSAAGALLKSFVRNIFGIIELDLSDLTQGLYVLRVESTNDRFATKIQKL